MKFFIICIVMVIFLVPTTSTAIDWKKSALNIYLSSEGYYQDISGNEEKSSLEEGWFYIENLTLDGKASPLIFYCFWVFC